MQEWLNWPAWKASKPQKGFGGSNPPLSAQKATSFSRRFFSFQERDSFSRWRCGRVVCAVCYCCVRQSLCDIDITVEV